MAKEGYALNDLQLVKIVLHFNTGSTLELGAERIPQPGIQADMGSRTYQRWDEYEYEGFRSPIHPIVRYWLNLSRLRINIEELQRLGTEMQEKFCKPQTEI